VSCYQRKRRSKKRTSPESKVTGIAHFPNRDSEILEFFKEGETDRYLERLIYKSYNYFPMSAFENSKIYDAESLKIQIFLSLPSSVDLLINPEVVRVLSLPSF